VAALFNPSVSPGILMSCHVTDMQVPPHLSISLANLSMMPQMCPASFISISTVLSYASTLIYKERYVKSLQL